MSNKQETLTQENYIATKEAAFLLNISVVRLRQLLQQGRVVGAYKQGRCWLIPLKKGMPQITKGKRGPKGTWNKKRRTSLTRIHINRKIFGLNQKFGINLPPISVRIGAKTHFCHQADIPANARVVYRPKNPLPCGAVLWIDIDPDQVITMKTFSKLEQAATI